MKRILVVDDEAATREAATLILQQEFDCAVDTVADASAAREQLHRTVPDAVLVSLSIPAMAGGAFMHACQQDPLCDSVPIVVMAVTPRAAVDAIRMGARGCIRKPVDTGGVMSALHHLLSGTQARTAEAVGARVSHPITSQSAAAVESRCNAACVGTGGKSGE